MKDIDKKPNLKPLEWMRSSKKDLKEFPVPVQKEMGIGLHVAQLGQKPKNAKPLQGFGGTGVMEMVEEHDGDTYRAIYTVKFTKMMFVLHAFQKKSKKGIATPKADMGLIEQRYKDAVEVYKKKFGKDAL